ncbi:gephyrin-like molybdotransferase receptor GlpR [Streptomyces sp. TR06-5]|uniref:divisome protein SepX/GlpR n=1 Tax=unclassified Streptomyces TaxID=2593676 RepID=UPI0039A29656
MSSSGLIYAVIVGAWAAYLVPMWLRRQDELNEARPTERFSTAIRLLSGKAAMERRYAKDVERRAPGAEDDDADRSTPDGPAEESVDVRSFAAPRTMTHEVAPAVDRTPPGAAPAPGRSGDGAGPGAGRERSRAGGASPADRRAAERSRRAKVLARRRRTTMVLFLCFSVGAVVAAVGGLAFLWAPAVPAALLSAYIAHLRTQERRRFHATMDRRRAEQAAAQLRERRGRAPRPGPGGGPDTSSGVRVRGGEVPPPAAEAPQGPATERPSAADRRALVEQTDHAEWVDQERGRGREQPEGEGWEPVPVPLPTYVNAPVAPRTARAVDLDAPDAWSSARSTTAAADTTPSPALPPEPSPAAPRPQASRSRRDRTPLFDQMADDERPRAAGE